RGRGGAGRGPGRRGAGQCVRRARRRDPARTHPGADRGGEQLMSGVTLLTFFVLAVFVGFEVVSKVSTTLHTPLMSGANAIHGVILVGAIIVTGQAHGWFAVTLGLIAIVLSTINMVGGFVVTDRMLEMFKGRSAGPNERSGADR